MSWNGWIARNWGRRKAERAQGGAGRTGTALKSLQIRSPKPPRGLGIAARVHSPTFALVNIYTGGRLKLFHLDLYRLETREQILAAGLAEYLEPAGVTVIEWAERWFGEMRSPVSSPSPPLEERAGERRPLNAPPANSIPGGPNQPSELPNLRWVRLDTLSETERRITYEDISA